MLRKRVVVAQQALTCYLVFIKEYLDGDLKTMSFGIGLGPETARLNIGYITGEDTPMQDNVRFALDVAF